MERIKVTAQPLPSSIHVNIRFGDDDPETGNSDNIQITSTHPIPNIDVVIGFIPKIYLKHFPSYMIRPGGKWRNNGYTLKHAIGATRKHIPIQVWSDAVGEASIHSLECANTEASSEINHMANGAYLAFGNSLYKLSAVGVVNTTQALAAMRKKKIEHTDAQCKAMLQDATLSASSIINAAADQRREAARILHDAKGMMLPPLPLLMNGYEFRKNENGNTFEVCIKTKLQISSFVYSWQEVENEHIQNYTTQFDSQNREPFPVELWLPISTDGAYSVSAIHADRRAKGCLPHISSSKACMEIADAPSRIMDSVELSRIKRSIVRCMLEVNLASLLTQYCEWLPEIKKCVPTELLQWLDDDPYAWQPKFRKAMKASAKKSSMDEELSETFTASPSDDANVAELEPVEAGTADVFDTEAMNDSHVIPDNTDSQNEI